MVIGSCRIRRGCVSGLIALSIMAFALPGRADEITRKTGDVIKGQITGVADGQVSITIQSPSGGTAKTVVYLTDIDTIKMDTPAAVKQAQGAPPATVIATLQPIVQQYAGLKADWLLDAMSALADAYSATGKDAQADAIYAQINQLYPNSPYQNAAVAGTAKTQLQQGQIDAAIATLQPLVTKANSDLAPSPVEGRSYAQAFLVYGQALEKKQDFSHALEAYLTVVTMFYQNQALAAEAQQAAATLRQAHPGVGVD